MKPIGAPIAILVTSLVVVPALADPPAASKAITLLQTTPNDPNLFAFNYGADGSPALNLLGLSPSKVQVSNTLTPFALSVPSLFSGQAGQSIGLDIAPAYALQNIWPIQLSQYQTGSLFERILIRSHVEVAVANGTASTDATKVQQSGLAVAYSTSLLDYSDPVALNGGSRYFDACIEQVTPLIQTGLREQVQDWSGTLSIASKLVGALQPLLRDSTFPHDDKYLRLIAPSVFEEYAALFPDERAKLPLGSPVDLPTTLQALAGLRDVFLSYAKANAADTAGAAQATAYAQEAEDLADGPLPAATRQVQDERNSVVLFVASAQVDPKLKRTLQRLTATPLFGTADPGAAAGTAGVLDAQVAYLKNTDQLKAMYDAVAKLVKTDESTYKTQLGNDVFMRLGVTQKVSDCVKAVAAVTAANPDLSFGLGYVEAGNPGAFSRLHDGGETVWLAGRVPLWTAFHKAFTSSEVSGLAKGNGTYLMLGGSVNYTNRASVTTGKSATPIMDANVFSTWLGLQGYSDYVRGSVQGGYTDTRAVEGTNANLSTSGLRWLASTSVKVYDGIWLGASYGTANGSTAKLDDKTFLMTVSFTTPVTASVFGPSRAPPNPPAPAGK